MVDGEWFDPVTHFKRARKAASDRTAAAERRHVLEKRFLELSATHVGKQRFKAIAQQLNNEDTKTLNGRQWTEANVRAFMRKLPIT
jgi:hypothetical protein